MTDHIGEPGETLEAVIVRRNRMQQDEYPDLHVADSVVLRDGPRAYKVATHWEILDRHTGELHHHSIKIETYRKSGAGWDIDSKKSITLEEKAGFSEEASKLATFIAAALYVDLPTDADNFLIVPVEQTDDGTRLSVENLRQLMQLSRDGKTDAIAQVLDWVAAEEYSHEIVHRLAELNVDGLRKLNTIIGVSALKAAAADLQTNLDNADEEYWQREFSRNAYVLSQVFAFPVVILKGKAYVGGKGIENTGGNIIDFLAANSLTSNAVLIEIKTPVTALLGSRYRGDIFNASADLSGAVLQISNYKQSLMLEYNQLRANSGADFEAFDPRCLVVIGNAQGELDTPIKRKSFELFRNGLSSVQVITFDELLEKTQNLIDLLEEGT